MTVHLTPELERLIQGRLASGHYGSATEVVGIALRLLEEHDRLHQVWVKDLREKVATGLTQLERGEHWDGEQDFDELEAELDRGDRRQTTG
jgi:antitoxin ParD1/3/4